MDKRRDRRRHRRRRTNDERTELKEWSEKKAEETSLANLEPTEENIEEPPATPSPLFGTLIPPPTTLISESLARYKDTIHMENPHPPTKVNEPKAEEQSAETVSASEEEFQ